MRYPFNKLVKLIFFNFHLRGFTLLEILFAEPNKHRGIPFASHGGIELEPTKIVFKVGLGRVKNVSILAIEVLPADSEDRGDLYPRALVVGHVMNKRFFLIHGTFLVTQLVAYLGEVFFRKHSGSDNILHSQRV